MKIVIIGGSGLIGSKVVATIGETRFEEWLSRQLVSATA